MSQNPCPFDNTQTCLGIGTTSPARILDVNGEIRVGGGNLFLQRDKIDLSGRRNWAWGTETFNVGDVSLFVSSSNTGYASISPVFTALSNGWMGIGVSTPHANLEIAGSAGGGLLVDSPGVITGSGSGLTSVPAASLTGTLPSAALAGVDGSGLVNVNAARLGGNLPSAFASTGSNTFTGNQSVTGNLSLSGSRRRPANLALPNTTSASAGVITLGSTPFLHNFGTNNTFVGASAGNLTMTSPGNNTAVGFSALTANTTGKGQSAFGTNALAATTTGTQNSAFGSAALQANTTGMQNAAFGNSALIANTSGNTNSAFGTGALLANTTGNSTPPSASSRSSPARRAATTPPSAKARSLASKLDQGNLALGTRWQQPDRAPKATTSTSATAAWPANQTPPQRNGPDSGLHHRDLGTDQRQRRDCLHQHRRQLGTITSSRRFKHEIADMGAESDLLMKLRPVAFYYKPELDETRTRQYGLVAEEVAQVAPQLVVYDKDGTPQTVRYHFVNAMLLNAVQKRPRSSRSSGRLSGSRSRGSRTWRPG